MVTPPSKIATLWESATVSSRLGCGSSHASSDQCCSLSSSETCTGTKAPPSAPGAVICQSSNSNISISISTSSAELEATRRQDIFALPPSIHCTRSRDPDSLSARTRSMLGWLIGLSLIWAISVPMPASNLSPSSCSRPMATDSSRALLRCNCSRQ